MPEATHTPLPDPVTGPAPLGAELADLTRQLADLLERTCSAETGAPDIARYLRQYATAAHDPDTVPVNATPLDRLTARFGLSGQERTLLLLAGLPEEHEGLASTFRALSPRGEPRPTAGLAALLTCGEHADRDDLRRLLTAGPAVRHGLLQVTGDAPLYERSLTTGPALWEAVHGIDAWPPAVPRVHLPDPPPAGLDTWLTLPGVRRALGALGSLDERTLFVAAEDERIALSRCVTLAAAVGLSALAGRVDPGDDRTAALIVAHAVARDAVPVLVLDGPQDGQPQPTLDLGQLPGPVLVVAAAGRVRLVGRRACDTVPVGPIGTDDRRRAWRAALPELGDRIREVAVRHPLDPELTAEVAADVRAARRADPHAEAGIDVAAVIRTRAGAGLPRGVRLSTPCAGWPRLVLPERELGQLQDAIDRLRLQPTVLEDWGFLDRAGGVRGVRLLFTGPPGTGKSLAAEVVATAAATDLLIVDMSALVSKWLGETEKNLAAVFDAAERTRSVLLLDEADALFAPRTQVSDAHDRYANLETAYLLQRLDWFDGLVVLATNLRQNIDPAFVRRMDFVVTFDPPDPQQRRHLWQIHLPGPAPLADDVDVTLLARLYPVPGAWIRNAAIAAGFLAAADHAPIGMGHLLRAVRREYTKAARPYPGDPPGYVDAAARDLEEAP